MDDPLVRVLANKPSGLVSFSDFYGKSLSAFNVSPDIGGKSMWNFDIDGMLNLNTPGIWYIEPLSNIYIGSQLWGSGGSAANNNHGGGGGYAFGYFTLTQGSQYVLVVGAPGIKSSTTYQEPWGGGQPGNANAGQGGGFVGIFASSVTQANAILIAGGGGGGGVNGGPGAGGGTTGQRGAGNWGGFGGTQTAGGAVGWSTAGNGGTAGGIMYGGKGGTASGGGGNGYFGGGGGEGNSGNRSGGGGGAGYFNSSLVTDGYLEQGSRRISAQDANPNKNGAGDGGMSGIGDGATGRLILFRP